MIRTGRVVAVRRSYSLSVAALLLAAGFAPSEADAQRITSGSVPRGIEIDLLDKSYAIHGNTARALREQMRILGPRGGWMSFPFSYEWSYQTQVVLTATGFATDMCRVVELEMNFMVETIYPRWNRPDDAPDELFAAWESFEELLLAHWEERRRYMIGFVREAVRQVQRLEEHCPLMKQRTNDLARNLLDRARETEREAIAEGARVQLRWPPEGYEELLAGPALLLPRGRAPAPRPAGGDFAAAAAADVSPRGMTGVVAGRQRGGEVEYLEAFGFADLEEREPLTADVSFRSPAFTEVVISELAAALDREGLIDLHAPLSSYLPDLDRRLGAVSLDHLLSHRSGLDDATPMGSAWSEILDDLDDRAVFTDPGAVFSFSRYDHPLALRALGRSIGGDVLAAASERILLLVMSPAFSS